MVIVIVAIVFSVVKPLVSEKSGDVKSSYEKLQLMNSLSPSRITNNGDCTATVIVTRDSSEGNIIEIGFSIQTNYIGSCYVVKPTDIGPLESRTFTVELGECCEDFTGDISVTPILSESSETESPDYELDSGISEQETFGGITCGSWTATTPEVSYKKVCSDDWIGYAEDIYTSYNPSMNWVISNNTEYNVDGLYMKTDDTGMGNLWAYKTFNTPIEENIIVNAIFRVTKKTSSGSSMGGTIYIWNGAVVPCSSTRQTGACLDSAGNTTKAVAYSSTSCDSDGWCDLVNTNFNLGNITESTYTIGFNLGDGWMAYTTYMEVINLLNTTANPLVIGNPSLSLIHWWTMDSLDASGNVLDSIGARTATKIGNPVQVSDGKIGKSFSFDGNSFLTFSGINVNTNNATISLWFKTSADFSSKSVGGFLVGGTYPWYDYLLVSGNGMNYYNIIGETNSQDDYFVNSNAVARIGYWNNVIISFENRVAKVYLNGVLIETSPVLVSNLTLSAIGDHTSYSSNDDGFIGFIDDVKIYNRGMSASEITLIYNQTIVGDETAPSINLISPKSQSYSTGGLRSNFILNNTVSEGGTINLSCNGSSTISAYTSLYGKDTFCGNGDGINCGSCEIGSSSCSITYDNDVCGGDCASGYPKPGELSITCEEDLVDSAIINFTLIATDNEEVDSCWYTLTGGATKFIMNRNGDLFYSYKKISKGFYFADVYCNDSSGNLKTASVSFEVLGDNVRPLVKINSPENNSYLIGDLGPLDFILNNTVSEGGTINLSCNGSSTISAYTSLYGKGTLCGNGDGINCGSCTLGSSSCSITYDNTNCGDCANGYPKPGYLLIICEEDLSDYGGIEFNITATDNYEVDSCWYSLTNTNTNFSLNKLTNNLYYAHKNLAKGIYTTNFYCKDLSGNVNKTKISFTVDNPDSCKNLTNSGETYYLSSDVVFNTTSNCINVKAENITLDCNGHWLEGIGNAIYSNLPYTTIKNCNINITPSDKGSGIVFDTSSKYSTAVNNKVYGGYYGIYSKYSENITVQNNFVYNNTDGINLERPTQYWSCNVKNTNNIVTENTVSNNRRYGINIYGSNNIVAENNLTINEIVIHGKNNLIKNNVVLGAGAPPNSGIVISAGMAGGRPCENITNNNKLIGNKVCGGSKDYADFRSNSVRVVSEFRDNQCDTSVFGNCRWNCSQIPNPKTLQNCEDCGFLGMGCTKTNCYSIGNCIYSPSIFPWVPDCKKIPVNVTRQIIGNNVVLSIDSSLFDENDTIILAEEIIGGGVIDSFSLEPDYNFNDTIVWIFKAPIIPSYLTYNISGSFEEVKGKWATKISNLGGISGTITDI
ncbi:MAG: LamG-like jellyroll fold domain-containing protein [Candidatus Pacearchaeota archaeon]